MDQDHIACLIAIVPLKSCAGLSLSCLSENHPNSFPHSVPWNSAQLESVHISRIWLWSNVHLGSLHFSRTLKQQNFVKAAASFLQASPYLTWACVDVLWMCFMFVCNPCISFTWHPHGQHYVNICELHLEAFLHVKCLAVKLLQGERPFGVTNQVSLLHLHSNTAKKWAELQPANTRQPVC